MSRPAIDAPAQFGVERDRPIQQQSRYGRVLEMARIRKRFVHRSKIVGIPIETRTDAVAVAERGKELQRSRKKASTVEEIDQPPGARLDNASAYRRRNHRTGIEQKLGACLAREMRLADRVEAVAERTGSHPEQPAIVFIRLPRQQRRVFRQELPQRFDVMVMDDASGFGDGPLEPSAKALFYFRNQLLPAWKPYSRASTNWASRCVNGSSVFGSCERARAMAPALPETISRASFFACLRRDSREGRAGSFDLRTAISFHERL